MPCFLLTSLDDFLAEDWDVLTPAIFEPNAMWKLSPDWADDFLPLALKSVIKHHVTTEFGICCYFISMFREQVKTMP